MFLGTYEPKLDEKGRVILPAKFREQLSAGVVLAPGQERCLYVVPEVEFERMVTELREDSGKQRNSGYLRVLFSGAEDSTPDRQGRVTIPPRLRKYAKLERDLIVIGAGTRAEIWDAESWNDYFSATEEQFANTEEEIIPGLY
ncbi:MAG: division/cell wall cluster transcriptional repressor MraZ [Scrofimicrobium sp.]